MFNTKKLGCLSLALIFLLIIYANSFISSLSFQSVVIENRNISPKVSEKQRKLKSSSPSREVLFSVKEEVEDHRFNNFQPPFNATCQERIAWFKNVLPKFEILKSTKLSRKFDARVQEFLSKNNCKSHFFMTWISPVSSFRQREFFAIESLQKAHPNGCFIILSRTLDTAYGYRILKPLINYKIKLLAVTPDLPFLFNETPVELWFKRIKKGKIDPGEISLSQNLSNLIRLAILYKYGGIYLDVDFIILKDFSSLSNSIGAQSVDSYGNWTRLNNAVLIFDKGHELLHKFLEEFASTFNGNKWGHNGPYLISRVVERIKREKSEFNFTILPPMAFYPVDWTRINGLFEKPLDRAHSKWVEAKLVQLSGSTYGVHLWNKQSSRLTIEEGSIISRLISNNRFIHKDIHSS